MAKVNVVLEGPDGGGKSTLAKAICDAIGMRVQQGSGPPKSDHEIETRMRDYNAMRDVVFDRHPCVSQPIYGRLRGEPLTATQRELVSELYQWPTLFIYCRSTSSSRHVVKDGENPEHIRKLTEGYGDLVRAYDDWALERANLIYRIGDDVEQLIDVVRVIAG